MQIPPIDDRYQQEEMGNVPSQDRYLFTYDGDDDANSGLAHDVDDFT